MELMKQNYRLILLELLKLDKSGYFKSGFLLKERHNKIIPEIATEINKEVRIHPKSICKILHEFKNIGILEFYDYKKISNGNIKNSYILNKKLTTSIFKEYMENAKINELLELLDYVMIVP